MFKRSLQVISVCAVLAFNGQANAALEKGWYIAANLGATEVDAGITNLTGSARLDDTDAGLKVLMGYEMNSWKWYLSVSR